MEKSFFLWCGDSGFPLFKRGEIRYNKSADISLQYQKILRLQGTNPL
jgi:hypothetical protein